MRSGNPWVIRSGLRKIRFHPDSEGGGQTMFQFFSRRLRNERGFTLIELLIVVAIIAILAAILIPNFLRARKQAQISATKGNLKNIGTALESYFVDKGGYPPTDNDLTPLVTDGYIRAVPFRP